MAILTRHNIQMKHPPPTSDPSEHCCAAGSSMDIEVQGQDGGTGVGHGNEQRKDTSPGGNTWWHAS
jgi:hypothetical protein